MIRKHTFFNHKGEILIMLKKINASKVESYTDFSVHITGLETLKYEEDGRYITLDWTFNPKAQKNTYILTGYHQLDLRE